MEYLNAADVLPQELLVEVSQYADGKLLYIPSLSEKHAWGERNGSKQYYRERNQKMNELFQQGETLDNLAKIFCLSSETIRKIVKHKNLMK